MVGRRKTAAAERFQSQLETYRVVFAEAVDHVVSTLKERIHEAKNIPLIVATAMEAVRECKLHGLEKKQLVIDLVHKVAAIMIVTEEEREAMRAHFLPLLEGMVDAFAYAAKGYMTLYSHAADAADAAAARCCVKRPAARDVSAATATVDLLYGKVEQVIRNRKVTTGTLISISMMVVQLADDFPGLTGEEKLRLVLQVVHRVIDRSATSEDVRLALHTMADVALPRTIEFAIRASKGDLQILNDVANAVRKCCA